LPRGWRPSDRIRRPSRCSPHGHRHFPPLRILAAENLRHNREYQEYLLRPACQIEWNPSPGVQTGAIGGPFSQFSRSPMRETKPMQTTTLPDISVDFMTWLNAELRKRIEDDENPRDRGLVNRLKNYFGRPVETQTAEA
jgi:hypothetical protein